MKQQLSDVLNDIHQIAINKRIKCIEKGYEEVEFMINGELFSTYSNKVTPIREINYLLENFVKSLDGNSHEKPFDSKWVIKVDNWFKTHGERILIIDLPKSTVVLLNRYGMARYGHIKMG